MDFDWMKRTMPRGLYGRAALILVVPVMVLVTVISLGFFQRHFEDVTEQLTRGVVLELREIVKQIDQASTLEAGISTVFSLSDTLGILIGVPEKLTSSDSRIFFDASGRMVIDTLRNGLDGVRSVDLLESSRHVIVQIDTRHGTIEATVGRQRVSASNPHQFMVLMATIAALMTGIAFLYLRNQLRPITRLADAADDFGKGRVVRYRPSGALEVRAAGRSFLDMRNRIERHMEQRTLMLSGVSHDLKTPLTRMKLALSLMDPSEDVTNLGRDVEEMEGLIDTFLDFSRVDKLDDPEPAVPAEIARKVAAQMSRSGRCVTLDLGEGAEETIVLRQLAIERALGNLVGNALRHGQKAQISVQCNARNVVFSVEDDGPGIPEDLREQAVQPFSRLDTSRNQDQGAGVGLGLAIARDIARQHGGTLRLSDSTALGGLKADLVLAR